MDPTKKCSGLLPFILLLSLLPFPLVAGLELSKNYVVIMDATKMPAVFSHTHLWYSMFATKLIHVYNTTFNGFSAQLTRAQVSALHKLTGFVSIFEDQLLDLHTTHTPEFLSLNSTSGIWPESDYGSEAIIGVVDTGIWPESASFMDTGLGPVPSRWKGICESGAEFNASSCNRKLIGARYYYQGYQASGVNWSLEYKSARDDEGHGTHTASTAAGNYVLNASMSGLAQGTARGMAPKARIAVYKACWKNGCSSSDILAAIDQAVSDGVDVISISLGGPPSAYYLDLMAIATFGAIKKGVFVSASAGNSGPSPWSVSNSAPWIATVGAGTLDRVFPAAVVLGNGQNYSGQSFYTGAGLPGQVPLVFVSLCLPQYLNPSLIKGKIVLCGSGGNVTSVAKGIAVSNAGGFGIIAIMPSIRGNTAFPAKYTIPGITVSYSNGLALQNYINSTTNPTASINFYGTVIGSKPAPQVAFFSSRGPNKITPAVLKPDIIAPGMSILAAWPGNASPSDLENDQTRVNFNIISGTSMSCPHISGISALIKAAHPDWSPAAIKSAMMTTAYITDNTGANISEASTGQLADAFAYGSGHVNPQQALSPGLVYDLTTQDYINFLCSQGYNRLQIWAVTQDFSASCPAARPRSEDFNYPSFTAVFSVSASGGAVVSSMFTRRVTNVGGVASTYFAKVVAPSGMNITVTPDVLVFSDLSPALTFQVNVTALSQSSNSSLSGALIWSDGIHQVQSPIILLFTP